MKKSTKKTLVLAAGAVAAFAVVRHLTGHGASGAHVAGWHGGGGFGHGHEWGHHGWGQQGWGYDPYAQLYGQDLGGGVYMAQQPYIPPVREIVDPTGHVTYT